MQNNKFNNRWRWLAATSLMLLSNTALAEDKLNSGDTAWLITATALVLFMTLPGLSLFYAGLVRSKNVLSILMQCFTITCLVSILWVLFVYGLAFGDGVGLQKVIGGLDKAFMSGVEVGTLSGSIPESVFAMFQMTFAIITPALIIGGFAERMRFSSMCWFTILWLVLVYAPVCHWVWGGGWLADMGLKDFAGGTVVHINAGVAALVAALVLGRRKGFPKSPLLPHNMTLSVMGAGMLWVGWFGFNAGSALLADGSAGMAMLVTHIGAAAGSLAWMGCEWIKYGKPSVLGIVTGMVAGLGTITPASGYVGPMGALAIGLIAGVCCFYATSFMKQKLQVDDSLDVFPVHGVGGIIGTICAGIFIAGSLGGVGLDEGVTMAEQVGVQLVGVAATIIWCGGLTFIILKVLDNIFGLRVGDEEETQGLDIVMHNETGYNL